VNQTTYKICRKDQKRLERWRHGKKGVHYTGFLRTHDSTSHGTLVRIMGVKIPRMYEFLSELELKVFLIGEWLLQVIDQWEQFPLLPYEEVFAIAKQLGVPLPGYRNGDGLSILSTDNIWCIDNQKTRVPLEVKPSERLAEPRVQELLEIKRVRWANRGLRLTIITEREIPSIMCENIKIFRSHYRLAKDRLTISARNILRIEEKLLPRVTRRDTPLKELALECDDRLGFDPSTSLAVVKHLIARKRWLVEMNTLFNPESPLLFLKHNPEIKIQNANKS
jgi:hypothetical protein